MLKYLFSLILSVSVFVNATAQTKNDTLKYYVTNSDDIVASKELADYVLFILPMKEENGKKLFPVIEYYANGQRKLVATSRTNKFPLVMEGSYLRFFPNGKRLGSVTVEKGQPVGDELSYYPNGKFYSLRKHEKDKVLLLECRDSTGTVLAEKGNGEWLEFDGLFTSITERGSVKDGLKEGVWTQFSETVTYKNGIATQRGYRQVQERTILSGEGKYLRRDTAAVFKSKIDTIDKFIASHVNRSIIKENNGLGKQMYVGFFVENYGSLNTFQVFSSPSSKISDELIRVVKLSSPWVPVGSQKGSVSGPVILPVFFALDSLTSDTTTNKVFAKSDVGPEFLGGAASFTKFLEKAIQYPRLERENNVMGKVFATFIVEKDGSISDLHVFRTPSIGLAEETLRVMRLSPNWKPGIQNGKPVRVQYTIPVNFSLGEESIDYRRNPGLIETMIGNAQQSANSDSLHVLVESAPEFPGGPMGFTKYLVKSVRYPESDRTSYKQGQVKITFVVEKDGSLTDFKIVSAPSKSLGEEALRVMKGSPKWKAGIQNGKPVRVQYTVPINFRLGGSSD